MTIRNINPEFGATDSTVTFESVEEMRTALDAIGFASDDGELREGRDYETTTSHSFTTLRDSDTTDKLTADDLGITAEQYAAALDESADAGETGHIRINGRRVYAQ